MKPKEQRITGQNDLFLATLERILNKRHPLYELADTLDWEVFLKAFGENYVDGVGRSALPTRLMVGIHYLKHAYDVSDEQAVACFLENPYWQYFCGMEYFVHENPFDRSSLTRWRKRHGEAGMEELLKESFETARRKKFIHPSETKRVIVDTTVQEKAIAFPTDARLYYKSIKTLVRVARRAGVELRQSYGRVSKRALFKQGRYGHAQQYKRAQKQTKKLKTYLGRVIRDVERKLPSPMNRRLDTTLAIVKRIQAQQKHDHGKVYSVHAPEVECIAKGKVHKKYEFGNKVSVTTTARNAWVVGVKAFHNNPFDGHTLKIAMKQVERMIGSIPLEAYVDQGYRGVKHHPEGINVHLAGTKSKTSSDRKWKKRRNAIEPIIGHMKSDNRMQRNYLLGELGDQVNAILAGCGRNIRKLLKGFSLAQIRKWISSLKKLLLPRLQLLHV